jgi:hypothetical protein
MFGLKIGEKSHEIDGSDGTHDAEFHRRMLKLQKLLRPDFRTFRFEQYMLQLRAD